MQAEHTDPDLLLLRITPYSKAPSKEGWRTKAEASIWSVCVKTKGPKVIKTPVKAGQRYARLT